MVSENELTLMWRGHGELLSTCLLCVSVHMICDCIDSLYIRQHYQCVEIPCFLFHRWHYKPPLISYTGYAHLRDVCSTTYYFSCDYRDCTRPRRRLSSNELCGETTGLPHERCLKKDHKNRRC